jgi:hypothetical protein
MERPQNIPYITPSSSSLFGKTWAPSPSYIRYPPLTRSKKRNTHSIGEMLGNMGALIVPTRTTIKPNINVPPIHGLITLSPFVSFMVTQPFSVVTSLKN